MRVPLLVVTDSRDVTSDLMSARYPGGRDGHLRFNTDLWASYSLSVSAEVLRIEDPLGRSFDGGEGDAVYWRKPFLDDTPAVGSLAAFEEAQRMYVARELLGVLAARRVWALVEPGAERRLGKVRQMMAAAAFFPVPEWRVCSGAAAALAQPPWMVKCLDPHITEGRVSYVRRWCDGNLSGDHVWFLQKEVQAKADVTIAFACGRCFGAELPRNHGLADWRALPHADRQAWVPAPVDAALADHVRQYMFTVGLRFGRLDFLRDLDGRLWFLEVNPNGQFAWLDLDGSRGLLDWVAACARGAPVASIANAVASN